MDSLSKFPGDANDGPGRIAHSMGSSQDPRELNRSSAVWSTCQVCRGSTGAEGQIDLRPSIHV